MSSLLSYASIMSDRENFRLAGTSANDFNKFDTPGLKYFKIFFYFTNGDSDSNMGNLNESGGLLAPSWKIPGIGDDNYYKYTSAWSYLKMNYEDERANNLEKFVNLLSNISSESPWYFMELSGLDAALERKTVMDKEFKIDETRSKISIKCLPDSFDDRIATLLDLYRSIVWSWTTKREVLPANLRKFDMGVFIYETPNMPFHKMIKNNAASTKGSDTYEYGEMGDGEEYKTSYKYIEFHNCEIDYGSAKGNFSAINNAEGIAPEYTIDIHFDDCYETRYNEMILASIGDMIEWDMVSKISENQPSNEAELNTQLTARSEYYEGGFFPLSEVVEPMSDPRSEYREGGFFHNAAKQLIGTGLNAVEGLVKKVALGNLYTFSLSRIGNQFKSLASGDVWSTARNVSEYMNDSNQRKSNDLKVNIFGRVEEKGSNPNGPIGNIYNSNGSKRIVPSVKRLGNLATSNTIANNI